MNKWDTSRKIAATLTLILLGIGYLAGMAKLFSSVGLEPENVKAHYSPRTEPEDPEERMAMLLETAPEMSGEKLAHVAHVHMIPYTIVFALCAFFVIHFEWPPRAQIVFMALFALSIPMDFLSMAATRFIHPAFYAGIIFSGAVYGVCVGVTILWSLYELWISETG